MFSYLGLLLIAFTYVEQLYIWTLLEEDREVCIFLLLLALSVQSLLVPLLAWEDGAEVSR